MAEKTLEEKIQEARAAGYTDEEINSYLNPKPIEQPTENKRSEEYIGMGQFGAAKAAELGLEAYGAKKLIVDPVLNAIKSRGMPPTTGVATTPPTTLTGGANPV